MKVGFIGLGRMGQAMAGRLLAAGHDLVVYNRTREKAGALDRAGAKVGASIGEACEGREAVITVLTDDKALRAVTHGGVLEKLPRGAIHVAMGTHGVEVLDELKAVHEAAGVAFVS